MARANEVLHKNWLVDGLHGVSVFLLIKLISLFYIVPFTMMAGSSLVSEAGAVKDISTVAVEAACAGIPYLVFLMLSARKEKENVRTTLLIRRNAMQIGMTIAFIIAVLVLFFSKLFSTWILTEQASAEELLSLQRMLQVSAIGIYLAPWMYDLCGYLWGCGEGKIVFKTKIIEWIVRYSVLFLIGGIACAMMPKDSNPMGMISVIALIVGCAAGLLCLIQADQKNYAIQAAQARRQLQEAESQSAIRQELLHTSVVFFLSALFGNASKIIRAFFSIGSLTNMGISYSDAKLLYGIQAMNCDVWVEGGQLLSILIFALFVGRMEKAFCEKNGETFQQEMEDWLNTAFYYFIPVSFLLFSMARPIYYVFYGMDGFELGSSLFASNALLVFLSNMALACWLLLIRLKKYSEAVLYLFVGAVAEAVSFHFLVQSFGVNGFVYASSLNCLVMIYLTFSKVSNLTDMDYTNVLLNGARTVIASLGMNGAYVLLRTFVFDPMNMDRGNAVWQWLVMVACCVLVYIFIMNLIGLRKKVHKIVENRSSKEEI